MFRTICFLLLLCPSCALKLVVEAHSDNECEHIKDMRTQSQTTPGLIMTGQGGSATRAAQEIVALAGTHDFGRIDKRSHDSLALREGRFFDTVNDVLKNMGSVTYRADDLPRDLHDNMLKHICESFKIMQVDRENTASILPWALKDPWLRVELPVFAEIMNFKLIHITRDVRHIHCYHKNDQWHDILDYQHDTPEIDQIAAHAETLANFNKFASASTITNAFNNTALDEALNYANDIHQRLNLAEDTVSFFSESEIKKIIKFAHVWAFVESSIHRSWGRSEKYFHMSQTNYDRSKMTDLSRFLGNANPDESTLQKMMGVYDTNHDAVKDEYWHAMQHIVDSPGNEPVREALRELGYEI